MIQPFQTARRRAIEQLQLQGNERVLIVGAGTGLDLLFLPPTVTITAIDLTPGMARRAVTRAAYAAPADIVIMNAEALAFPSEVFDCVLLH